MAIGFGSIIIATGFWLMWLNTEGGYAKIWLGVVSWIVILIGLGCCCSVLF